MHRLLLDQGLPLSAAKLLRFHGVDALHAEEVQLASAADPDILQWAKEEGRACVTLDHDFHKLLAESNAVAPSVILLRFQFLRAQTATSLILSILEKVGPDLVSGIAATATPRGIRVRKLPLKITP